MKDAADELVILRTYTIPIYAETDRLHLENEGIPAFVFDGNTIAADYFLGNAVGYAKLMVPRSRVDEALAVVNRHRTERHAFSGDPPLDEPTCLACGKPMPDESDRCAKCGWSFADGIESDDPE